MMPEKRQSIFEKYAHEYDLITNAKQREVYHAKEVEALVNKFKPKSVLDAGCATGLTSRLFSRYGIETIGLDRSRRMIEQARLLAKNEKNISFIKGSFGKLPKRFADKFDLIVCVGNSLSGTEDFTKLVNTLKAFYASLRAGGTLIAQVLNYASIEEGTVMPIRVTSNNGIIYQRYSIRRGNKLSVHAIRLDNRNAEPTFEPFVHEFEGLEADRLLKAVKKVKFKNIRTFGNLFLTKRFGKKSRDLVMTAKK